MSNYKHGDWYCKPANKAEAREIVERAVASGAVDRVQNWRFGDEHYGVCGGVVKNYCIGIKYTIEQLREKFPLPNDQQTKWNGEGLPPIGVECEIEYNVNCWRPLIIIAEGKHTYFVRYTDLQDEYLLQKTGRLVFRPIRTERERWVYAACAVFHGRCMHDYSGQHFADAMGAVYDAMQSGELKVPEVD